MDDKGVLRKRSWIRSFSEEDRLANAKIPAIHSKYTLSGTTPPPGAEDWLDSYQRGDLLLVPGTVPASRKAAWLAAELVRRGESVRWISSDDYVTLYKDEWEDDDEGRLWRELKYSSRGYDVVVLDGLGEEPNTDFERKIISALIKGRVENGLSTIVTSPLSQIDLAVYSTRIAFYFEEGSTLR